MRHPRSFAVWMILLTLMFWTGLAHAQDPVCGKNQTKTIIPRTTKSACYDNCKGGKGCGAGTTCTTYNSGALELCVPDALLSSKKTPSAKTKSGKEPKLESTKWLKSKVSGNKVLWTAYLPDHKPGKHKCVVGKRCMGVSVELKDNGVAEVLVGDSKAYKQRGGITYYKAVVKWGYVNEGFIGLKMCPAFEKAFGHDMRLYYALDGAFFTATKKGEEVPVNLEPKKSVEGMGQGATVLCGPGAGSASASKSTPRKASAGSSGLAKQLVGKGFFVGGHMSHTDGGLRTECVGGRPCIFYYIKLDPSGTGELRLTGAYAYGNIGHLMYQYASTIRWSEDRNGRVIIRYPCADRAGEPHHKDSMFDLYIDTHRGKPHLFLTKGTYTAFVPASKGMAHLVTPDPNVLCR